MTYSVIFEDYTDPIDMEKWALNNCKSFVYRIVTDVYDENIRAIVTYYEFHFLDKNDALWFRLMYK